VLRQINTSSLPEKEDDVSLKDELLAALITVSDLYEKDLDDRIIGPFHGDGRVH